MGDIRHHSQKKRLVYGADWRIYVLLLVLIGLAAVVGMRLYSLQVGAYESYRSLAESQHTGFSELYPDRGEVFLRDDDEGLYPLAVNREYPLVYISPRDIEDEDKVAHFLSSLLELDLQSIDEKFSDETDPFEIIQRRITDEQAEKIQDENLAGVHILKENYRYYPAGELAAQVVGFVGSDGHRYVGRYGLESSQEDLLNGKEGKVEQIRDASGRWISITERSFEPAQDGADLILTINHSVQYETERILRESIEEYGATSGTVIIQEVDTGNIVAMANEPSFDPNKYSEIEDMAVFINPAVSHAYESGSVFKPLTMAMAIDQGKVTPDTEYVDTGEIYSGGFTIQNSEEKVYGKQTMRQVLEESINTGTIFAQQQIGNDAFRDYVELFGFGEETGVQLPHESSGNLNNLDYINRDVNFYTASFGQGISVTPLQLVSAYSTLANGGRYMQPNIIDSIHWSDGSIEKTNPIEVRRVLQEQTARTMSDILYSVVENGHGKRAGVPGYKVAGKTGTAQVAKESERGYDEDKTIGTFAGFAPVDDPRFAMVVKIDNPTNVLWAESSAAPTFGKIMQFLLQYYNVPPTEEIADIEG